MAIVTMTQALKKLYKAVVGEDTTKNNPTKIVSDLADNWSGGGGGSSDLSTATVTVNLTPPEGVEIDATRLFTNFPFPTDDFEEGGYQDIVSWYDVDGKIPMVINKGKGFIDGIGSRDGNYMVELSEATISGNASYSDSKIVVTGDCTITGNWVLVVQP